MALRNDDPLALDEPGEAGQKDEKIAEDERRASVWDHEPLSKVACKVFHGHSDAVSSCHLCYDDARLLTSSHDNTAILWNTEQAVPLRHFGGTHGAAISECSLIPGTNSMVTVSWDKTMVCWDLETGKTLWTSSYAGLLTSCSVSYDGKLVVCVSDMENAMYITMVTSGECLRKVRQHHRSTIMRCRFDPQGQHVATVSMDRTIKLWDLLAHRTTMSINSNHNNTISSCCFTDNGRFLCTASWDRSLQLWDLVTGAFRFRGGIRLGGAHVGSVSSCIFSADAQLLVSGSYDKTVALWDTTSLSHKLSLKGHRDWVTDVSVSADKNWMASCSKDCTCRLWSVKVSDHITEVMERRKNHIGVQLLKCEECGESFCLSQLETSELLTRCVFCRMKTTNRYNPQPPP